MISLKDISDLERKRKQIIKEIYIKIYEQCSRKIKQAIALKQKQTFLVIPGYLVGFPSFDVEKATLYIKRQFELGGLDVTKISQKELYVSWHKASKTSTKQKAEPEDPLLDELPSLINLKKAANKYKK
jgi:hypothetical protein